MASPHGGRRLQDLGQEVLGRTYILFLHSLFIWQQTCVEQSCLVVLYVFHFRLPRSHSSHSLSLSLSFSPNFHLLFLTLSFSFSLPIPLSSLCLFRSQTVVTGKKQNLCVRELFILIHLISSHPHLLLVHTSHLAFFWCSIASVSSKISGLCASSTLKLVKFHTLRLLQLYKLHLQHFCASLVVAWC